MMINDIIMLHITKQMPSNNYYNMYRSKSMSEEENKKEQVKVVQKAAEAAKVRKLSAKKNPSDESKTTIII